MRYRNMRMLHEIGLFFLLLLVVHLATVAMLNLFILWDDYQAVRPKREKSQRRARD